MGFYKTLFIKNKFKIKGLPQYEKKLPDNICPICKDRETNSITKTVKTGNFNGKYFEATGEEERTVEWWTCKKCTKIPTPLFIEHMIKHFN